MVFCCTSPLLVMSMSEGQGASQDYKAWPGQCPVGMGMPQGPQLKRGRPRLLRQGGSELACRSEGRCLKSNPTRGRPGRLICSLRRLHQSFEVSALSVMVLPHPTLPNTLSFL